jgi:hypothetical protein
MFFGYLEMLELIKLLHSVYALSQAHVTHPQVLYLNLFDRQHGRIVTFPQLKVTVVPKTAKF